MRRDLFIFSAVGSTSLPNSEIKKNGIHNADNTFPYNVGAWPGSRQIFEQCRDARMTCVQRPADMRAEHAAQCVCQSMIDTIRAAIMFWVWTATVRTDLNDRTCSLVSCLSSLLLTHLRVLLHRRQYPMCRDLPAAVCPCRAGEEAPRLRCQHGEPSSQPCSGCVLSNPPQWC